MGELFHLACDFAEAAVAVALRLALAFQPLETAGEAGDESGESAELGICAGPSADRGSRRRHLPAADFGDGPSQGVVFVIGHGVPLAEPVNRTLDGAQGLAPPDRRLGTAFDPLAQASHTL